MEQEKQTRPLNDRTTFLSQKEVADFFGVSRARIQQIELRALRKLRNAIVEDPICRQLAKESGFCVPNVADG